MNLKERAQAQVAQYPQYQDYFDDWITILITKEIKTKMGIAFKGCETALARPEVRHVVDGNGKLKLFMTAWSLSNKCSTSIPFEDVRIDLPITLIHVRSFL